MKFLLDLGDLTCGHERACGHIHHRQAGPTTTEGRAKLCGHEKGSGGLSLKLKKQIRPSSFLVLLCLCLQKI